MNTKLPYQNIELSVEERVEDLIGRMTWEEKVLQLSSRYWGRSPSGQFADISEEEMAEQLRQGIGQICQLGKRRSRSEVAVLANRTQKVLKERSRLGIPAIVHEETLHGMIANGVTALGTPLHLAATWDPTLIERSFSAVAMEMRRAGVHLGLSPVLDLGREPRWGRFGETFGEDPHLVSKMGVAAVRGLQGDSHRSADHIIATGKHFLGYGQCEGGHNVGPYAASWFDLMQNHLEPWRAVIQEAKLGSVMPSYSAIEGEPAHGSVRILTELLRDQLGFEGIVVSDYGGVAQLHDLHRTARNPADAAKKAVTAGMDCELPNGECYEKELVALAENEEEVARAIDTSVRRVLKAKFELGLFENPFVEESAAEVIPPQSDEDALKSAIDGIVLLKNDQNLLPIDPGRFKSVAVIGPHADENLLGPYFGTPRDTNSYLDALKGNLGPDTEIHFEKGCRITKTIELPKGEVNQRDPGKDHRRSVLCTAEDNAGSIRKAVDAAQRSDLAILFVGDDFATTKESFLQSPHGDRADLDLMGGQKELFLELQACGTPLVVVVLKMGCIADEELFRQSSTLVDGGCGGQSGPEAVAQVLLGKAEPSGRLPFTLPWSSAHLPVYSGAPAAARRGYGFVDQPIAYPLGYGLSYTRFELSEVNLTCSSIKLDESVMIRCRLSNVGDRRGSEVVQVYHSDLHASKTRPERELVSFQKVQLQPGESQDLIFEIEASTLGWWDEGVWIQEAGDHHFWVSMGDDPLGGQVLGLRVCS